MNSIVKNIEGGASLHEAPRQNPCFRILVVEDDPAILHLNVKVISKAGYAVEGAMDGVEGWKALHGTSYDLLVTDLNMPRMNGIELIKKVRAAKMDLPIILATGTPLTDEMVQEAWFKTVSLLQKPFMNAQLLERVKQLLAYCSK